MVNIFTFMFVLGITCFFCTEYIKGGEKEMMGLAAFAVIYLVVGSIMAFTLLAEVDPEDKPSTKSKK